MIPMYSLLLAAPLTLAFGGEDDPATTADNVLRTYDVSTLAMPWIERPDDEGSWLMPAVGPNGQEEYEEAGEPEMTGAGNLIDIVLDLYGAEFEYEGRHVSLSEDGRLVIRGPEGLHQRVDGILTFLESVVNAEAVLAIDRVVLTGPVPDAALIDAAAAEAWLNGLDASADHSHHEVRLRGDREARIDLGHMRNAVVDFDVEIAQGVAIQDPIVVPVMTGTRMRMVGAPAEGGLFLAYVLELGDRIPKDATQVSQHFWSGSERGGLQLQRASSRIDDLEVLTRSQAVSTFLPAGKALVLTQEFNLAGGQQREVVLVRQIGGGLPTRHELPLSREGTKLVVLDLGATTPPSVWSSGTAFAAGGLEWIDGRFHHEPVLRSGISHGELDLAMELINPGCDDLSLEQVGRFTVTRPFGAPEGSDVGDAVAEQTSVTQSFEALRVDGELLDVEITVTGHGGTPVHARLPIRPGTGASLVLGVQSVEIHDYDVEVAQAAAIADLVMETVLDGLCLWIEVTPSRGGDLMLVAKGGIQLRESSEHFDFGGLVMDYTDQTTSSKLMINECAVMQRKGDAWVVEIGDTAAGGLSLSITVRKPGAPSQPNFPRKGSLGKPGRR